MSKKYEGKKKKRELIFDDNVEEQDVTVSGDEQDAEETIKKAKEISSRNRTDVKVKIGDEETTVTKEAEELVEKFASKAQQRFFYAKANEKGKEGKKFKKYAKEFSKDMDKEDWKELPDKVEKEQENLEEQVKKGDRVVLKKMDDPYTKLTSGDEGTVDHIDDLGQIHVKWDAGSTLALIPGEDEFDVIQEWTITEDEILSHIKETTNPKMTKGELLEMLKESNKVVEENVIKKGDFYKLVKETMSPEAMQDFQAFHGQDLFDLDGENKKLEKKQKKKKKKKNKNKIVNPFNMSNTMGVSYRNLKKR